MTPAELEALVTAAVEGDPLARIRLIAILRPVAYDEAWYKLFSHADADDVANLTMIRVMRRLHRLRERRAVKAWTRKIARRLAMTLIAQRAAKPVDSDALENLPDPGEGLSAATLDTRRALAALGHDDAQLLILRFLLGLKQKEVAARTGIPRGSISRRVKKAAKSFRRRLLGYRKPRRTKREQ